MEAVERETSRLQHLWAAPNNPMGKKFVEMTGADLSKECSAIDLLKRLISPSVKLLNLLVLKFQNKWGAN